MRRLIFLLIALLCLAVVSCGRQQQVATTDAADAAVRIVLDRYLDIFNDGNRDLISTTVDSSFVCYHPAYPDNLVGIDGFTEWADLNWTAFPDLELIVDEMIIKGDRAIIRWTFNATQTGQMRDVPPTGKPISITGMSIVRVSAGKVTEEYIALDLLGYYRQLGFTFVPPEA